MLRLLLDWLVDCEASSIIPVAPGARWYSEALLPSPFRGDSLAESHTHADGVVADSGRVETAEMA